MRAYLSQIEHYAGHSVFLFGAFAALVDYLHSTPMPQSMANYTVILGAVVSGLVVLENKWRKNLAQQATAAPTPNASPSSSAS
jgi:hypothetical protein